MPQLREAPVPVRMRALEPQDWPQVRSIYEEGIATGLATFETVVPSWEEWDAAHLPAPRLVAESTAAGATLLGWAALSPASRRRVYRGVAEVSVYVRGTSRRAGVGHRLLEQLARASEEAGLWTLQASVFPENEASVRLHEACGFRTVGRRRRMARLAGTWRDVLLMERRSEVVGND